MKINQLKRRIWLAVGALLAVLGLTNAIGGIDASTHKAMLGIGVAIVAFSLPAMPEPKE